MKRRFEPSPVRIRGARTHNLKNISCEFPPGSLTVVTGLSGSGKSSLAFDTLYAEGRRRYVESLSTYARQFIARLPRPDVDAIDHIPPAIALEQKNPVRNARSTIGTGTEVNDFLRLIFAKIGTVICPQTGEQVRRHSPASVTEMLFRDHDGKRLYVLSPIPIRIPEVLDKTLAEMRKQGYTRIFHGGEMVETDDPDFEPPRDVEELLVMIDRMKVRRDKRERLADALEGAFSLGQGRCRLIVGEEGKQLSFSDDLRCPSCPGDCGLKFRDPEPRLFNFSNPLGACPECQGFGRVTGLDWGKIIPDPTRSIERGAIAPFTTDSGYECFLDLERVADEIGVRLDVPWKDLTPEEQEMVKEGRGEWYGIQGFFDWLETKRYKVQARIQIARYRGYSECSKCWGTRLVPEALAVKVGGLHIGDLCDMQVRDLAQWFDELELTPTQAETARRPLEEIRSRLRYLMEVGLGYLTLSRQTRTLSGGESQRINLSTALGGALTETLYVLDEPTVGLHPRDTARLIGILRRLTELGNTVVVVEHDLDVMRAADHLVDIGPEAGEKGGEIVYIGPPAALTTEVKDSKTAYYLQGEEWATDRKKAKKPSSGRREPKGWITVEGAHENNLQYLTAKLPLGVLCCVTGVSGSGKSTLIKSCFFENYRREFLGESKAEPGRIVRMAGLDQVDDIQLIDQTPLSRSSRSNPATYLKSWDHIRKLLASQEMAKEMMLEPRDFSFNVPGGRCESCEGTGYQVIDMHFMADVQVVCEKCEGRRFQDHVLRVTYKGKNVSEILDLTINEATEFFGDIERIIPTLKPMANVGLGYLRLGQATATLSGGEAQRLKLASHLASAQKRANALLLFDEPTTGLHPADLDVLLGVFQRLLKRGFSLIVIEHNLELIRRADWVIDLGPEGGDEGGQIIAEGPPETVAATPESLTGRCLAEMAEAKL